MRPLLTHQRHWPATSTRQSQAVRRRDFIALFGGAATVWPFGAGAQQTEQKQRIGVLNSLAEDPESQAWDTAFRKRLNELGWIEGRNIQLDYRWAAGKVERLQEFAKELIRRRRVVTPASSRSETSQSGVPYRPARRSA